MKPAERLAKEQAKAKREALELAFLQQLKAVKLDDILNLQFQFHPRRKWAFDFCWQHEQVALEIDGGTFSGGRHVRGEGYAKDCEKLNEATILGWRVLRVTAEHVKSGKALQWVERALGGK